MGKLLKNELKQSTRQARIDRKAIKENNMTRIVLKNPYFEEEIKVKETHKLITDMLNWMGQGNLDFMTLQQVEPSENIITLNPKHFAKIEIYEDEVVKDET